MEQKQIILEIIKEDYSSEKDVLGEDLVEEVIESALLEHDTSPYFEDDGGEHFDITLDIKTVLEVAGLVKIAFEAYVTFAKEEDSIHEIIDKIVKNFNKKRKSRTITDDVLKALLQKILDKMNEKK